MMLLLCFDLPRDSKEERRQAAEYRKRLVELGFSMKQYSLYEREVKYESTRKRLIEILKSELPDSGKITLYLLPDEINNKQVTILGNNVNIKYATEEPKLIVL